MGNYLDMTNNQKPNARTGVEPNENYARKLLLFSIGAVELIPTTAVDQSVWRDAGALARRIGRRPRYGVPEPRPVRFRRPRIPRLTTSRLPCHARRRSFARCAALVALAGIASLAGCAIRQDATGVSRVGIGLWGFGDPPGVNWNLDWPRREPTALPPRHSDGVRAVIQASTAADACIAALTSCVADPAVSSTPSPDFAMDDNRACAHRCIPASPPDAP
jgi:hypothetical protein